MITYDTLIYLKQSFSDKLFMWIMGSDCAFNFDLWDNWQKILNTTAILMFERPNYGLDDNIYNTQMFKYLKDNITIVKEDKLNLHKLQNLTNGIYYFNKQSIDISSTEIRKQNKNWLKNN